VFWWFIGDEYIYRLYRYPACEVVIDTPTDESTHEWHSESYGDKTLGTKHRKEPDSYLAIHGNEEFSWDFFEEIVGDFFSDWLESYLDECILYLSPEEKCEYDCLEFCIMEIDPSCVRDSKYHTYLYEECDVHIGWYCDRYRDKSTE
jgi:hypothetical protein